MIGRCIFAAALLAASLLPRDVVGRASTSDREKYPDIEYAFANWANNVFWSAEDVVTKDGYILTLFKI